MSKHHHLMTKLRVSFSHSQVPYAFTNLKPLVSGSTVGGPDSAIWCSAQLVVLFLRVPYSNYTISYSKDPLGSEFTSVHGCAPEFI